VQGAWTDPPVRQIRLERIWTHFSAPAGRGPGWPESIPPSPPLNF